MKILVIGAAPGVEDLCRTLSLRPGVLVYRTPAGPGHGRTLGIPPDQGAHLEAFMRREQPAAVVVAQREAKARGAAKRAGYRALRTDEALRAPLGQLPRWVRQAKLEGVELLIPNLGPVSRGVTGTTPDCTTCGACCFSPLVRYVPVSDGDMAHMSPEHVRNLTVERGDERVMRMIDGRCAALRTTLHGEFLCSIYEERPALCREFAHASPECRMARRERFEVSATTWRGRHGRLAEGILRSPLLAWRPGLAHAFTTREGGVSVGPLSSLNLARRPGEVDEHLVENWRRAVAGVDPSLELECLALISQVHGAEVLTVRAGAGPLAVVGEADGLVTTTPGVVLAVRGADCVPVLIAAPGGVAAVHSGWRGTAAGVVSVAVAALARATGAAPSTMAAAIGPHISGDAYEVGEEVVAGLTAGGLDPAVFLHPHPGSAPHVDLGAAIASQLLASGVPEVERMSGCTKTDPRFFSHRGDPATGRQAALIALLPS